MDLSSRPAHRGWRAAAAQWLAGVVLFALALAPRAILAARFQTVDEAYHWFERATRFGQAIQSGNYAGTNLVGHPGVTTMWLGAGGVALRRWLIDAALVNGDDLFVYRALIRLPVALATALCVALAYPLLRRLIGARPAWLAALLWAAEPFVVAHSQLLHVDALLTSFVMLGLLAALVAFRFDDQVAPGRPFAPRWGMLVASAVCGGLALLTKSPAVLLPPMVGMIGLAGLWRHAAGRRLWRTWALPLLAWAALAAAVWLALWPAAWLSPLGAAWSVLHQAEADGGAPHAWGNFFRGQAVADPGPLFYPVVLAFRLAPWTLLGALVGVPLLWWRGTRGRAALAMLALFALLFVLMMSVPPKKFDRYVLPVVPALDIIAAAGLAALAGMLRRRPAARAGPAALGWLALVAGLAANLAWYHPYEIAYYSPLLGGGPAAARNLPIGWGEGFEQAGAFITAQPDGAAKPAAAWFEPVLRPFVPTSVLPLAEAATPGRAGYVVLYIDQIQRQDVPDVTALYLGKLPALYTVRIHGIEYAYVYQAFPAVAHTTQADFGTGIRLIGYDLAGSSAAAHTLRLALTWQVNQALPADYTLFVHVLGPAGTPVARIDVPPGGPAAPTSAWQPGRFVTGTFEIALDPAAGAGQYWLALGVYNPRDGTRLPLSSAPPAAGAPADGPDALRLQVALP